MKSNTVKPPKNQSIDGSPLKRRSPFESSLSLSLSLRSSNPLFSSLADKKKAKASNWIEVEKRFRVD